MERAAAMRSRDFGGRYRVFIKASRLVLEAASSIGMG